MILNVVIALILSLSPISVALLAKYVTLVEVGPNVRKYCLAIPVFYFWP